MTAWVLIWVLYGDGWSAMTSGSAYFQTKVACEQGRQWLVEQVQQYERLNAVCLETKK